MFTSDETPDLDSKISAALEDLRADFSLQLQEAKNEIQELKSLLQPQAADTYLDRQRYEGPASSPDDLSALHFAITRFDIARTQAEILEAVLAESGRFASRAAIFVGQEETFEFHT